MGTRAIAAAILTMTLSLPSAASLDLHYRMWTTEDGLPTTSVRDIAQTPDGYIWVATLDGLVRFDGVRMRVFQRDEQKAMTSNRCVGLHVDRRGGLWVGTEDGGAFRIDGASIAAFGASDGVPAGIIQTIAEDGRGRIWIETQGGAASFDGRRFVPAPPASPTSFREDGELQEYPASVFPARQHDYLELHLPGPARWLWTSAGSALRFRGGRVDTIHWLAVRPEQRLRQVLTPVLERDDGRVWILEDGYLHLRDHGVWRVGSSPVPAGILPLPRALFEDREGTLWIVGDGGVVQATPTAVRALVPDGSSQERAVYTLTEDDRGRVWATTQERELCFENGTFKPLRGGSWSPARWVTTMRAEGGDLLAAGAGGIVRVMPGSRLERLSPVGEEYHDVIRDRDGMIWAGSSRGLVHQTETGWQRVAGLPSDDVKVLLQGRDGSIWAGTYGGLARVAAERVAAWTTADGLSSNRIRSLREDASGMLWIGTYDGGLDRFGRGRFTHIGKADGLYDNGVFAILEDDDGRFWMSSNRGVFTVSKRDLDAFADGTTHRVVCSAWRAADGMPSSECNGGRQPAGFRASDGTLWFATQKGIAVFDPRAIATNAHAPTVVIEEITTDRRAIPPGEEVELAPGERRLEVRYTANTFIHPEGARFRHRLVGFDDAWIDAGDRRFAQYARIPPGDYELQVMAANSDGVWSEKSAVLPIRVRPLWWQTEWFRWGLPIAGLGLLATGYGRRVAALKRRRADQDAFARRLIESQEAERKRIAGELHDGIGQTLAAIRNHALLASREGIDPLRQVDEIASAAAEGVEEVRKVAYGLRPYQLDRLGLKRALEAVIEQTAGSSGIPIVASIGEVDGLFRPDDEINMYRILQESLNNLVRHAAATRGRVAVVVSPGSVEITIEDNGVGFDPALLPAGKGGLGLSGISERARILGGRSSIRSLLGEGTVVTVILPLESA